MRKQKTLYDKVKVRQIDIGEYEGWILANDLRHSIKKLRKSYCFCSSFSKKQLKKNKCKYCEDVISIFGKEFVE